MELKLPLLGDVMTEGTVAAWLVPDGATVSAGEPLYQLETDKVSFTVEAPAAGTVRRVVAEGATVPVGTVVGELSSEVPERASAGVRATPMARRLAREHGIDLTRLNGGRLIREADVMAAVGSSAAEPPERAPLAGRRKVIAERMHASLQSMAQLTIAMEVDFTLAEQLRAQLKQLWAQQAPTITDFVMRATVLALREHPALNATLEADALRQHEAVNLGLAVDADDGLIVPVIHAAHALSLRELAARASALAEAARTNELTLEQLQGGTFTVTTLGSLGVDFFTPIVNPPQVAILGIGRVFSKWVRDDERLAMYLNLSFDHRAIDGAPAARFLQTVKRYLELPASLIT